MSDRTREYVEAVGVDVTTLSPDDMYKLGIIVTPRVVTGQGQAWKTHEQLFEEEPELAEKARDYARQAAWFHLERQYTQVQCPRCRAFEGRSCRRLDSEQQTTVSASHTERRVAATEAGLVTFKGLRLQQVFPCPGVFRKAEQVGRGWLMQCDVCGDELGVMPPKPGDEEKEDQRPLGQDDIPL